MYNNDDGSVMGHNEDNDPHQALASALVHATFTDEQPPRSYTALQYPGQVPGVAFGFNDAGLVITQNSVSPSQIVVGGLCTSSSPGLDGMNVVRVDERVAAA